MRRDASPYVALVVGLLLLSLGTGILVDVYLKHARVKASAGWPQVDCVVTHAEAKHSFGGANYALDAQCVYSVEGTRYGFDCSPNTRAAKSVIEDFARGMAVGSIHACSVNPEDPHDVVFEHGEKKNFWVGVIVGSILAYLGGGMMYGLARRARAG